MKRKHYILLPAILVSLILIITSLIYYSINNALASVENEAGIIVPEQEPVYHFAMICENVEDSFWLSIKKGVERASKEFNVAVEFNWPSNSNTEDQLKHMDMAIASRVDGIVAYVWDEQQAGDVINRAVAQGIPVITIGNDAKNSSRKKEAQR
jgi:ribose transport system substrate-binding protein